MTPMIVNLLAFAAVFFAVFAANAILGDVHSSDRRRVQQRLEDRYREQQRRRVRDSSPMENFSKIAAQARDETNANRSISDRFQDLVEQSGVSTTVERVCLASGLSFLFAFAVVFAVSDAMLGIIAGAVTGCLPIAYLMFQRKRRQEKLRVQLPDAFELMSRVLRSGQTVAQGMQAVSDEFPRPISLEFLYCAEQMNLGLSPEMALREMQQRTGLLEIKIFTLAVVVQRQTGGNLSELLDKIAQVVRERFRIHGMIQSLTAQGRFQAAILLSLPPAMFVLLMIMQPEYELILLGYPWLIALSVGMMFTGFLWIRRIIRV